MIVLQIPSATKCYWTKQVFHCQYFYFEWAKEFQTLLHSIAHAYAWPMCMAFAYIYIYIDYSRCCLSSSVLALSFQSFFYNSSFFHMLCMFFFPFFLLFFCFQSFVLVHCTRFFVDFFSTSSGTYVYLCSHASEHTESSHDSHHSFNFAVSCLFAYFCWIFASSRFVIVVFAAASASFQQRTMLNQKQTLKTTTKYPSYIVFVAQVPTQ